MSLTAPALTAPRTTLAPPIVHARWLTANRGQVSVVDTRRHEHYGRQHLAGAHSLPLAGLLVEDSSGSSLRRLGRIVQHALDARGIGPDDHVVLVDDTSGSAALGAALCELAGVRQVSCVLGGERAWSHAWEQVEREGSQVSVASGRFDDVAPEANCLATRAHLGRTGKLHRVIDVRSQLEHEGIVGAPCCRTRGAVPGSIHLEWTALVDGAGEPHCPERVREIAAHFGVGPEHSIVVYCHAGARSAVAARILTASGFPDVRLSLGSWHEWAATRPIP